MTVSAENAELRQELARFQNLAAFYESEIQRQRKENAALRADLDRSTEVIEGLRAELEQLQSAHTRYRYAHHRTCEATLKLRKELAGVYSELAKAESAQCRLEWQGMKDELVLTARKLKSVMAQREENACELTFLQSRFDAYVRDSGTTCFPCPNCGHMMSGRECTRCRVKELEAERVEGKPWICPDCGHMEKGGSRQWLIERARAEKAKAELAALKAKIAGGVEVLINGHVDIGDTGTRIFTRIESGGEWREFSHNWLSLKPGQKRKGRIILEEES